MKTLIGIPTYRKFEDVKQVYDELCSTIGGCDAEVVATCIKACASVNRNAILDYASDGGFDYIIMCDDDTRGWDKMFFNKLIEPITSGQDKFYISSARLVDQHGSPTYMMGEPLEMSTDYSVVGYVPTACIAFKYDSRFRFDEEYIGSGFEDTDFVRQYQKLFPSGRCIVCNKVKVVHINEKKEQHVNWEFNSNKFNKKWGGM